MTGRPSIARLVRTQFVQDETKYAFRLAGWELRRGWPGVETVTPMLDPDGVWRVSGYFIR